MTSISRMPEQNQVVLAGRLTHDPDLRYTQKGQALCRLDIAVNRRYKDPSSGEWKDDTTFVPIVAWGAIAERCKGRIKKGSPVHVEGRLSSSEYTDKSGQKRRSMQVTARRIQFLASVSSSGQDVPPGEPPAQDAPASQDADFTSAEAEEEVPF